jgi:hypothetical protein
VARLGHADRPPARPFSGALLPRQPVTAGAVHDLKRTFATVDCRIAKGSFDHFVGEDEQGGWNSQAERFRSIEIDD